MHWFTRIYVDISVCLLEKEGMETLDLSEEVLRGFRQHYGTDALCVVRAPGRVNLIGEYTDYNGGFVLPMAIDRQLWIAITPREDDTVRLYNANYEDGAEFSLGALTQDGGHWSEYVKGVARTLMDYDFHLRGWDGFIIGNIPIGAGLSSSAALELATARAFCEASGFAWEADVMARICQAAENTWMGVHCGLMDPMISACGKEGHAILMDCRSLEVKEVALPDGVRVVVLDTSTRRGLIDTQYNQRRNTCEEAAAFFGRERLRDVSPGTYMASVHELDPVARKRTAHVIGEDQRTLAAVGAMRDGDAETLGQLMYASHESLRDQFEVSSEELNTMVECAMALDGCYGARMTGAGFGGCAVALVDAAKVDAFVSSICGAYQAAANLEPKIYVCEAVDGATRI